MRECVRARKLVCAFALVSTPTAGVLAPPPPLKQNNTPQRARPTPGARSFLAPNQTKTQHTPPTQNTTQKNTTIRYALHPIANAPSGTFGTRSLTAGALYPIRMGVAENLGVQALHLYWRAAPGGTWGKVPFSAFYSVPNTPTYASVRTQGYPEPRVAPATTG